MDCPGDSAGRFRFLIYFNERKACGMLTLRDGIVELYKKAATSLPKDIEEALRASGAAEQDGETRTRLDEAVSRIITCRTTAVPVCADSGHPVFFVQVPKGLSHQHIREVIEEATRAATKKIPLQPNAVDAVTGENTGDNVGSHFPLVYTEETDSHSLVVDLMLRGGDCEAQGRTYSLPRSFSQQSGTDGGYAEAGRDFAGVALCVREALREAQGRLCPPYILGVAVGGSRDHVAFLSKKQLLRRLPDSSTVPAIAQLEADLLREINEINTAATGSLTPLVLGIKATAAHRHPDSYFVDISFACWAHRRARLIW